MVRQHALIIGLRKLIFVIDSSPARDPPLQMFSSGLCRGYRQSLSRTFRNDAECRIALDESSKIAKRVSINLTDRRKQGNAGSEKKQCANAELKWRNRWLDAFVQLSSFLRQHNGCDH